jgi:hypothetical protein
VVLHATKNFQLHVACISTGFSLYKKTLSHQFDKLHSNQFLRASFNYILVVFSAISIMGNVQSSPLSFHYQERKTSMPWLCKGNYN